MKTGVWVRRKWVQPHDISSGAETPITYRDFSTMIMSPLKVEN